MAASKSHSSLLPLFSIFIILLAITGQAFAGRDIQKQTNKDEKKEPQFFIGDGSFLIPGFGRVLKPHRFKPYRPPFTVPSTGGSTGIGGSPPGQRYIPGGDDTFVPNPGFEVPNPGYP
ncbi:putative cell wall protein [Argentina anserina]|uniref:putative cell wall protein n=1 Tax=Argentina anserina TaxID=57926 RepID=UPI0021763480|nr:putative cell wall protein [Potentilla anserina]